MPYAILRFEKRKALWLLEHLASRAGQDIAVKSEIHRELLDEMWAEQQNSGMAFSVMSLQK